MQVLLCVGDDFLRRGLKFAVILELRRGVLNRAKSSIVCNASVTNFRVIPDFPAVFGYPNVNSGYRREYRRDCKPLETMRFRGFVCLRKLNEWGIYLKIKNKKIMVEIEHVF